MAERSSFSNDAPNNPANLPTHSVERLLPINLTGRCGSEASAGMRPWIFDGAKFDLVGKRFQGACSDFFTNDWLWLYLTKTR